MMHVFPLNDLYDHDTEGATCICCPRIEDGLVIHNSFDGRELAEDDHEPVEEIKQ